MSDTIVLTQNKWNEILCECGTRLKASVSYWYSGIVAFAGDEDGGSPYPINLIGGEELVLDLDTSNANHSTSELETLYCERCKRHYDLNKRSYEFTVIKED